MKKISETIYEDDIQINLETIKLRETVRAVILNEKNEVYMLYSNKFDDYTFPGGGIKYGEKHFETLSREIKEEIGANVVEIIKPIGYTEEIRYGIRTGNNVYRQKSYYYLCEISDITEPSYIDREKNQGLEMKWIEIEKVIKHNEIVNNKRPSALNRGFKTVLMRENAVLKYLKEQKYA